MRKIFIIIIVAGILFSCGFQKNKRNDGEKPVVTVSILPLKTFVEKIAGNDFKVNVLLPPGASPADFTLVPSQIKDITLSKVWFRIGHIGFEYSWKDKIQQVNLNMKVVDLSEGLDLISDETLPSGYKSTTSGINPHTWMSPSLVKQMAVRITKELSTLNPDKKSIYNINYKQFVKDIEELDNKIAQDLKDYKGRQFIMFHPSLSYFAREYGLVQHSLEPGGKEPTPQRMAEVVDLARMEGIRVIYIQSDLDQDQARVFAEEIDGKIVQMWPLNPAWFDNLKEITGMLIDNF
ncbi:MAG: zinc ABC transporter substrate-binding protein [Prolixibacteraceae bacterium]|jgi:zinc transport system substrate-binding protein|nr:zinc ABC transporter substrate-binding protein [Prolixibacteraceae bacterium]